MVDVVWGVLLCVYPYTFVHACCVCVRTCRFSCVAKYSSDQELHSIMLPDADDSSENVEGFDHVFIEV